MHTCVYISTQGMYAYMHTHAYRYMYVRIHACIMCKTTYLHKGSLNAGWRQCCSFKEECSVRECVTEPWTPSPAVGVSLMSSCVTGAPLLGIYTLWTASGLGLGNCQSSLGVACCSSGPGYWGLLLWLLSACLPPPPAIAFAWLLGD